jgi:CRP-like cAMP-binding protein
VQVVQLANEGETNFFGRFPHLTQLPNQREQLNLASIPTLASFVLASNINKYRTEDVSLPKIDRTAFLERLTQYLWEAK